MTNFASIVALLAALPIWGAGMSLALAADTAPRLIEFESPLAGPQALQGLLRLPDDPGPSPAVVLLHGCGGGWRGLDERWGKRLAEWGYVTLTVDRFGTRGITSACTGGLPPSTLHDAYRALNFLTGKSSVDPSRVAVVGFSQGAMLALLSVERGQIERSATEKFRAAIGFYPPCLGLKGQHDGADVDHDRRARRLDAGQGVPQPCRRPRRLGHLAREGQRISHRDHRLSRRLS